MLTIEYYSAIIINQVITFGSINPYSKVVYKQNRSDGGKDYNLFSERELCIKAPFN